MDAAKEKIWQWVCQMNRVWTVKGDCTKLKDYFHRHMVAIVPQVRERLEGREACIAGWEGFVRAAQIHSWQEYEPSIQLYGSGACAVVSYYYTMSVTMGGRTMELKGRDMMTLAEEEGQWWLVADQFSSNP